MKKPTQSTSQMKKKKPALILTGRREKKNLIKTYATSQAWWYTPVSPALRR
jgi:hypothetical protein